MMGDMEIPDELIDQLVGTSSGIPAPGVHGVIAVPQLGRIFASATDARQIMAEF